MDNMYDYIKDTTTGATHHPRGVQLVSGAMWPTLKMMAQLPDAGFESVPDLRVSSSPQVESQKRTHIRPTNRATNTEVKQHDKN